jgi:hypothetical protein
MASDDNDLLIFAAVGLLGYYFYAKSQEAAKQQSFLVGAPQPDPGLPYTGPMPDPMAVPEAPPGAAFIQPIATLAGKLTAALVPIPLLGPLAAAEITVPLTAISEQLGGNLSTGNILTDVAILTGPMGWAALGVGKLLGIDLFGHDLDQVNKVLVNALKSPPDHNNVQFGQRIYVLGEDQALHEVQGDVNALGFSWRAIIAVDQRIIDVFQKGAPITQRQPAPDVWQPGFKPSGRPADSLGLRRFFGKDIMFNLGNSTSLHGPWEADVQNVVSAGYQAGGPADLVFGDIKAQVAAEQASWAKQRAAGF